MSIDRESHPQGGDWGEVLGLPAADIAELSKMSIEFDYDHAMDRAFDEIGRLIKLLSDERLAAFSVPRSDHIERVALIVDLKLAGPGTITVIHNKPTSKRTMGTSMWIFDAHKETVEYRHGNAHATKTGWARSPTVPLLQPHGDTMAILVKDPELVSPHESMPMDDDGTLKTQGQVDALNALILALQECNNLSHDETITDYQYC